jgi:hypothetical protein
LISNFVVKIYDLAFRFLEIIIVIIVFVTLKKDTLFYFALVFGLLLNHFLFDRVEL